MKTRVELVSGIDLDSGEAPSQVGVGPLNAHGDVELSCWVCCCGSVLPVVVCFDGGV